MSSYEFASIGIAVLSAIIASYGIMAAFAAKRSARAAEIQAKAAVEQARHAQTQAEAAIVQARAAERQLDLATLHQQDDRITRAMRARRTVLDCRNAVKTLEAEVVRYRDGNVISAAHNRAKALADALEDTPPIFPTNVRKILFDYIQRVQTFEVRPPLSMEVPRVPQVPMELAADQLVTAMDVAIAAMIRALPEIKSVHANDLLTAQATNPSASHPPSHPFG
ncbi:hypothetical protein [Bosea sp. (in: a-proteobacteria)]|uniref:hypothetical protein n=1 Tax=Bosea sp. (in: a-proteobacteria) TaxID=1871050 RepID=UPI003B3AE136